VPLFCSLLSWGSPLSGPAPLGDAVQIQFNARSSCLAKNSRACLAALRFPASLASLGPPSLADPLGGRKIQWTFLVVRSAHGKHVRWSAILRIANAPHLSPAMRSPEYLQLCAIA
jgi:hypothetical protein